MTDISSDSESQNSSPRASPIRAEDLEVENKLEYEAEQEVEDEDEELIQDEDDDFKTPQDFRFPLPSPTPTPRSPCVGGSSFPDPFNYSITDIIEELLFGFESTNKVR